MSDSPKVLLLTRLHKAWCKTSSSWRLLLGAHLTLYPSTAPYSHATEMYLSGVFLYLVALQAASVNGLVFEHPGSDAPGNVLEARNNVGACQAVLIALKASKFCSAFVPITDKTSTVTQTGTATQTQVTITAACVNAQKLKRNQPSTTPKAPSTTQKVSTTPKVPSTTQKVSTTPKVPSTTPKASTMPSSVSSKTSSATTTTKSACKINGVPPAVSIFACEVIKDACLAFVKPGTKTVRQISLHPSLIIDLL